MLLEQKISNSTIFSEIERTLHIVGMNLNSDAGSFDLYYRILYSKDGKDVGSLFINLALPSWHVDNSQRMQIRDANFQPMPNPDFKEEKDEKGTVINEGERFMTMPAFDYIKKLMLDLNVPLKSILSAYIAEEDKDGRFDF